MQPTDTNNAFSRIWTAFDSGQILPACAWCGRVQIDGAWLLPPPAALAAIDERYTLSHSICDVCAPGRPGPVDGPTDPPQKLEGPR